VAQLPHKYTGHARKMQALCQAVCRALAYIIARQCVIAPEPDPLIPPQRYDPA